MVGTLAQKCLVRYRRVNERHLCINILVQRTTVAVISHQIRFVAFQRYSIGTLSRYSYISDFFVNQINSTFAVKGAYLKRNYAATMGETYFSGRLMAPWLISI